ncbi:MAG TPA: helix-turn-helix domain-containing protein [Geminicoccaceae bacterium]|nr:helix-turn-helix domain-containing protein [Geminicoccus sp.]HMU51812.1 helix-turn-helix domain-containing protein [Geminicoccaceae bacterium]
MTRHRSHSIELKRPQEFIAGETVPGLAQRHDVPRNPIRIRVAKHEAEPSDAGAADLLQASEAEIAALERLVGRRALELEFPKGASRSARWPRGGQSDIAHLSTQWYR